MRSIKLLSVCVLFAAPGCTKMMKVIPNPPESVVRLDGVPAGRGVTDLLLAERRNTYAIEVCGPPGYFCEVFRVEGRDPRRSLKVDLAQDLSFRETVEFDLANKWLKFPVGAHYGFDEAWKKVMACVNDAYADMETLDARSGYLKTAWRVKDYGFPRQLKLRSRLIVSVDSPQPLQFKVRLEMERFQGHDSWESHPRVFTADNDALGCLQGRLR